MTQFRQTINSSHNIYFNSNCTNELQENLTLAIKDAARESTMEISTRQRKCPSNISQKPWFDLKCKELKLTANKSLRQYRKSHSKEDLDLYIVNKKLYRNSVNECKNRYSRGLCEKLSNVKNNAEFWATIKALKPRHDQYEEAISLTEWEQFYATIYIQMESYNINFTNCTHPFLDQNITLDELQQIISLAKSKKAPGSDGIPNELLKNLTPNWEHYLLNLFNKIMVTETMPKSWSEIQFTMIHKKGAREEPLNYRGIAQINTICKLFTGIINRRLQQWSEENDILKENQMGFRTGRGTTDCIFTLTAATHLYLRLRKTYAYAAFIDFTRAFDSVSHHLLYQKLYEMGISVKLIRLIKNLYDNARVCVKNKQQETSEYTKVTEGVLQGDPLSPLLFALLINDLEDHLRKSNLRGINIDGHRDLILIAYADDLVIFGDSPVDINSKLKAMEIYCKRNSLLVNTLKTKILTFHRGRPQSQPVPFKFKTETIERVNKFCYLGVMISSSGKFMEATRHAEKKTAIASNNINAILEKAKSCTWHEKHKLIKTVLNTTTLYAAEVWGLQQLKKLENTVTRFNKNLLLCQRGTPHYMVRAETAIEHIASIVIKKALKWWKKILEMRETRYPKMIYNRLLQLDKNIGNKLEYNWASQIRDILFSLGQNEIWENQYISNKQINEIVEKHKDYLIAQDMQLVTSSRYNDIYKNIKQNYETEEYLNMNISIHKARILAQLRMASKRIISLTVYHIRHQINAAEICSICNLNQLETMEHILLHCPCYNPIRTSFLLKYLSPVNITEPYYFLLKKLTPDKIQDIFRFITTMLKIRSFCRNE